MEAGLLDLGTEKPVIQSLLGGKTLESLVAGWPEEGGRPRILSMLLTRPGPKRLSVEREGPEPAEVRIFDAGKNILPAEVQGGKNGEEDILQLKGRSFFFRMSS